MGNIKINKGIEDIKIKLELINEQLVPLINNINQNLQNIKDNWKGQRADNTLKELETIILNNNKIPENLNKNIKFINDAYEKYKELEAANITQKTPDGISPTPTPIITPSNTPDSTPEPTSTIEPSPTQAPTSTIEPSPAPTLNPTEAPQNTGGLITPNLSGLKFNYDDKGNIKRYRDTDFYPVRSADGISYLLYLGGRTPTDPIPANMPIVMGLHGYGERSPSSKPELSRLLNNGIPEYLSNKNNQKDIIAILPQIANGNFYPISTVDGLHNIYATVNNAFGARDGMDMSGISMGGHTTMLYISRYPQDVSSATIMSGAPDFNLSYFKFNSEQLQNIRNTDILIVSGKNDWKNNQYNRAVSMYSMLTGNGSPDYTISKEDSLQEIANNHKMNGGIKLVEISDAGHNTWDLGAPAVVQKYQ